MDKPIARGFSWWWPSTTWVGVLWAVWFALAIIAGMAGTGSPVAGFVNFAIWYVMFVAIRFVGLQAVVARPPLEVPPTPTGPESQPTGTTAHGAGRAIGRAVSDATDVAMYLVLLGAAAAVIVGVVAVIVANV